MEKRYALITGATSGIGYELAKLFAKEDYDLVLVARNKDNLKKTAKEMKAISREIDIHIIAIDLFDRNAARIIYDKTKELGIIVTVLVNNAGQGEWGTFLKNDIEREIDLIELNIITLLSLTKYYLRDMKTRNEGKILFTASSVAKVPSPYMAVYGATKSFVLSFAEALSEEIKDTNISITALQPDATDTDFFHKAKAENTVTYKEKELYKPEVVAKAAFKGLINEEKVVVPGILNKIQKAVNTIIPDSAIATNMKRQMRPSTKTNGRNYSSHKPSLRERDCINSYNVDINGDY